MLKDSNMIVIEPKRPVTKAAKPVVEPVSQFTGAKGLSLLQEERKLRENLGRYLILFISGLCAYTFVLAHIQKINEVLVSGSYVTLGLTVAFFISVVALALTSGYHLEKFGVTLKNWKRSLIESILFTIPILIVLTLVKWALIQFMPIYHHQPLFNFHSTLHPDLRGTIVGHKIWMITLVLYALMVAPLQELVSRGGVQSSLKLFMTGKRRDFTAILLTALIFSTTHLTFPIHVVALCFLAGLFWGWLFYRHKTLIGVSVSHALLGVWFFWLLGVFT